MFYTEAEKRTYHGITTQILFFHHLEQIKAVVFDKTGTLTHGKPGVTHVMLFVTQKACPYQLFMAIVGLAERNSEHPLGIAMTDFARKVGAISVHLASRSSMHLASTTTSHDSLSFPLEYCG